MNLRANMARFERFGTDWRRLLARGTILLVLGAVLAVASVFKPNVMVLHARDFSWLPVAAFVVLIVGFLECFDAAIAEEPRDFFFHLPIGVLDVVVAAMIILSISDDPARLTLMIAAYLIVKGILRAIIAQATEVSHKKVSTITGTCLSVGLGFLIWAEWPSSAAWFLAFCLSVETCFRGWALMIFSLWLRTQKSRKLAI